MIIFYSSEKLKNHLNSVLSGQKTIGFAPTMGALHQGHVSLVAAAKKLCDVVVCSIFVNPTQFNDLSDLDKYPRTLEADKALLVSAGCDILFAPEINEIYSAEELELKRQHKEDKSWMLGKNVDFGLLDKVMEGAHRPGHFNGVAQVVSKLFRIVEPHKAFFGQKDFQQLSVIRSMVKQLEMPLEIVACPIVREADGLAMSSRNTRLSVEERKNVTKISGTLFSVKEEYKNKPVSELIQQVEDLFKNDPCMTLEYFDIVDSSSIQTIDSFGSAKSAVACIAVKLESVRLIDNIVLF